MNWTSEDVKTFFLVFTNIFSVNRKLRTPPLLKFLDTPLSTFQVLRNRRAVLTSQISASLRANKLGEKINHRKSLVIRIANVKLDNKILMSRLLQESIFYHV